MKNNSATRILGVIVAVLAAVLVIGVLTFAGPCMHDDGSTSVCHTAQIAIIGGGVAIAVLAVVSMFLGSSKAVGALLLLAAAGGVFVALSPGTLFPLCMMSTMRCHLAMQPFAQFIGIAIAAISLIAGIRALRARA